jgi:hypothetical protein
MAVEEVMPRQSSSDIDGSFETFSSVPYPVGIAKRRPHARQIHADALRPSTRQAANDSPDANPLKASRSAGRRWLRRSDTRRRPQA